MECSCKIQKLRLHLVILTKTHFVCHKHVTHKLVPILLHSTTSAQKLHRLPLKTKLTFPELKMCHSHVVTMLQLLVLFNCPLNALNPVSTYEVMGFRNPSWEMLEICNCQVCGLRCCAVWSLPVFPVTLCCLIKAKCQRRI